MTPLLAFDDVGLTWPNQRRALHGIDLQVRPSEFVTLVGPSGCGKSTLLRLASGLITPTEGNVKNVASSTEFVFQDPTLLPWLDTRENVALSLRLGGLDDEQSIDDALRAVGLGADGRLLPKQLSGGMKMRASVARALVTKPDLFLLDEPFSAIDEIRREELNLLILQLHRVRQFACLFVTHSVAEAILLSDRVIVMSDGRIHQEIPVDIPRLDRFARRFDVDFIELTRLVSTTLRESSR